jgi:hypothetical protein
MNNHSAQSTHRPHTPTALKQMGNHRSSQAARRRTSFLRHINAPLHKRRAIMSSPLSKELRAEHGVRDFGEDGRMGGSSSSRRQ